MIGFNQSRQWGPKIKPASVATVASPINKRSFTNKDIREKSVLKIPTQAYAMWACSICLLVDDQEGLSGRKLELEAKKTLFNI